MTQLTLSKSNYLKESKKLDSYERYLPPLDLKRKQLLSNQLKERKHLVDLQKQYDELMDNVGGKFPMLASSSFSIGQLIEVKELVCVKENMMGLNLPKFDHILIAVKPYGLMTKPLWLDLLSKRLINACEIKVQLMIQHQRVELLNLAVRKATQRVNLVSEILIPEARKNMKKIKIFLSDNERASVVRSKIAKSKKKKLESLQATELSHI